MTTTTLTQAQTQPAQQRMERMNLVIVGHVDHGKSTVLGRLLADTGSLPEGKLDQVKATCARNARPFEYAFLLDALKNEQAQGITIDTARCFFKTAQRHYIINDAPGHIEFLKNMVTGAARAEAALLVIDAHEGIQENSKRHGYMVSMLGIKQLAVLVNKMDLVDYDQKVFDQIVADYSEFLANLGVHPEVFVPVSAREGENIARRSKAMEWYEGPTTLEQIDAFKRSEGFRALPFRMPVQDIYKFTAGGDDRRIVAGTIETGTIRVGDPVSFYPSGKRSTIKSIEGFNTSEREEIGAGWAAGFQLTTQIYIKPGELMVRTDEETTPKVGRRFRANLFWMGHAPLIKNKQYKLKLGAANVAAELAETRSVLDASELGTVLDKQQIDRHDVGEIVIETHRPVAFDERNIIEPTGRFVIVDEHEIAGAGVILEALDDGASLMESQIRQREFAWEKGAVTPSDRVGRFNHTGKFIIVHGPQGVGKREIAREVEKRLFTKGCNTYYFGIANLFEDLVRESGAPTIDRDAHLEKLGELARIMTDAGLLFITTVADLDDFDLEKLRLLNQPNELFVVNIGGEGFDRFPVDVALHAQADLDEAVQSIVSALTRQHILLDYSI